MMEIVELARTIGIARVDEQTAEKEGDDSQKKI
jgi:hypothetical protein